MTPLTCRGCGAVLAVDSLSPYRCPNAGTDAGDHVIGRDLDSSDGSFPLEGDANPFLRYRHLTYAYSLALRHGVTDDGFVQIVSGLDEAVRRVSGRSFVATPLLHVADLAPGIWVKDETGNVSGSHKARHLMGLAILGEVMARVGLAHSGNPQRRLAIASCGNAALAAAVVARAWDRPLDVFIPTDASPRVVQALGGYGATIHVCRRAADVTGDPCYHAFVAAVRDGAVPFCCQGTDNGLTIEGGETLAWELISELAREEGKLDRLFVQVGGGALASACIQAFRDAAALGLSLAPPRIHAVQTRGAFPLRRAWERVAQRIARRVGIDPTSGDATMADSLRAHSGSPEVREELAYAATHRREFMWPWETAPASVAHGILDDETYDWLAIVRGMIDTGGFPLVVGEERLVGASALARRMTGIDVDETGSAGLAGLLELRERGAGAGESLGVIFSGVRR